MTRYNSVRFVAVLAVVLTLAALLVWFSSGLIVLALWPLLVLGSTVHDLLEGPWEPLALVNLIFSIVVLVAYGFGARWLWRRI